MNLVTIEEVSDYFDKDAANQSCICCLFCVFIAYVITAYYCSEAILTQVAIH